MEIIMQGEFRISHLKNDDYYNRQKAHTHGFYEIYYLVSGKRRFFVDHSIYTIQKGDMIVVPRGAIHRSVSQADKAHERIVIYFSEEYVQSFIQEFGLETLYKCFGKPHLSIPQVRRAYVEELMQHMEYEAKMTDVFSKMLLRNHLYELLIFLIRCSDYQYNIVEELDELDEMIEDAARYICENYSRQITLPMIAGQVNMSTTYFSRKFKKLTGFGFKEYLNNVRLKAASEQLLETKKTITEIALECGFNDSNYFGDIFKKMKGVSPNQYRKNREFL